MRTFALSTVGMVALAMAHGLSAQTAPGDQPAPAAAGDAPATDVPVARITGPTSYDAAFFAHYAPRTALDIARRVPGFSLELGDQDVRGFSAAAGNVVFNGQRPSSKSESLEATLQRIPASRVTSVQIGPGSLYGADYASRSQVLNILLSAEGGIDGNVTGSLRRHYTGKVVPDGSASVLVRRGASTVNLSGGFNNVLFREEGTDTLTDPDSGELVEFRRKFNSFSEFDPYLAGSWALERGPNRSMHLNGRWSPGQFDLTQRNRVSATGEPDRDDSLLQDYDRPTFEIGGDITRQLAGGAVKLLALATRRKRDNFDAQVVRNGLLDDDATQVGGFEQRQIAQLNETIGRLSWTRQNLWGLNWDIGGEAVLNTLDNATELLLVNEDGSKTEVDLPVANAKVKEKRGEAFVNVGRGFGPNLRVDAGMRYEFSHLTVSGDAEADRKLQFYKPSLTVDWKPGGGWHSQFAVKRTVAQLDFYDFVSVAELSTDRINAGNQNLQPQRAWEFRATVDRPILGDGLVKLDLGYDHISMLQDRVLIFDEESDQFFDAPGNLGTGKHLFGQLTVDAPLSALWPGLRVKFDGTLRRTRVEDPISGEQRNFSDFYPDWQWQFDVRRDAGPWSYGFLLADRDRFTFFRTDEFDINRNDGPFATAFVEFRPDPRTSITLDLDNALSTRGERQRIRFFPNRAVADVGLLELRERDRHRNFGVTIKRTFGSAAKPVAPAS